MNPHQQIFSTGEWFDYEEYEPGRFRQVIVKKDEEYLAPPAYDATEQDVVLRVFTDMLRAATRDGGVKRARGEKPPWWRDGSHMGAVFSHFRRRALGEMRDSHSGAHPYVHAAWRLLAVAYQETNGQVDPEAKEWHDRIFKNQIADATGEP